MALYSITLLHVGPSNGGADSIEYCSSHYKKIMAYKTRKNRKKLSSNRAKKLLVYMNRSYLDHVSVHVGWTHDLVVGNKLVLVHRAEHVTSRDRLRVWERTKRTNEQAKKKERQTTKK